METIAHLIHIVLHLNVYLQALVNQYGTWTYAILFLIVFCETGLVITPFLPGDSLLFAAGSIFAISQLNVHYLVMLLILATFCGDNTNYWIGRTVGKRFFKPNNRILKQQYVDRTHAFYEKHGAMAIILARFVPIVRTFMPFVAGLGHMTYRLFILFSLIGALLWVAGLIYLSYFFGQISWVKNNFSIVIVMIIIVSILPAIVHVIKHRIIKS